MLPLKQIFSVHHEKFLHFILTAPAQKNRIKIVICILLEYLSLLTLYKTFCVMFAYFFFHFNLLVALFLLLFNAGSSGLPHLSIGDWKADFIALLHLR